MTALSEAEACDTTELLYTVLDGYPASLGFPIMHQVYVILNCHHIKSFHPPVKQYTTTHHNTEFKYYTCSLFFISNTKVSRAALWVVLCSVWCILASVLIRIHPLKFPYLPRTSPLLRCTLPPPLASSLPSFPRSVHASILPPLPLPPSLTLSIPHSVPPLAPSHPPSFLALSLPASRRPIPCTPSVCVFGTLH